MEKGTRSRLVTQLRFLCAVRPSIGASVFLLQGLQKSHVLGTTRQFLRGNMSRYVHALWLLQRKTPADVRPHLDGRGWHPCFQ